MVMVGGHPRYGVNALVESVAPGATWTPISVAGSAKEVVLPSDPKLGSWQELTSSLDAAMQPINRRSTPEEQAAPLVFLNSSVASYVNGLAIPIDGGLMGGIATGRIDPRTLMGSAS